MPILALVRHGQSEWNLANRFTGWVDVNLTEAGEGEARRAGALLKAEALDVARCFTSCQTRAIRTLWLTLEAMGACYLPVTKDYRLNERHYGALTGLDKSETAARHGEEQVNIWRRSYDIPPPPMDRDDPENPSNDPRYRAIDRDLLPDSESLKTTLERVLPYWLSDIRPHLLRGETLIISAHGNSLRALVKQLFSVSDEDIVNVEIPTGNPLLLELDEWAEAVTAARYLDAERARPLPAIQERA